MSDVTKFGLNHHVVRSLKAVFAKHPHIEKAFVYGSRAKGNYRHNSDIDITLVGASLDTTELLKIEGEIDDLLLPYKVDLSIFHQIENPDLIDHIQRVRLEF